MPITYHRDDPRQLITVTITDPRSLDELLLVIDRQAREDTWRYAMLYDLTASHLATEAEAQQLRDHVRAVGGGRPRGPVALALAPRPSEFRIGLHYYPSLLGRHVEVDVLLTPQQIDAWLARWDHATKSDSC